MARLSTSLFLISLLTLISCSSNEVIVNHTIEVSPQQITLQNSQGASATFTVTASGDWIAETTGGGFILSHVSGGSGESTVTVTAMGANDTHRRHELGAVTIRIPDSNQASVRSVVQMPATAPQTLLMVLCGRGNLVGPFDRNIENALKAVEQGIPGDGRILVFRQTGPNNAEISELFYNEQSGKAEQYLLKSYNEPLSSTDGPTITRIINDMQALAPANQYGLVMGSHATGWVLSKHVSLSVPGMKAPDNYWLKSNGEAETRGFGYDNGTTMNITTLAQSLEDTKTTFDYLIFDACFMSSIEALYDLRHAARRIIASPTEVMLYGFPYNTILPQLFRNQGKKSDLQAVCESFHSFYSTTTITRQSGCIAMTDCAELDALADVIRRINIPGQRTYDPEQIQSYEGLSPHLFYDLKDFVKASCRDSGLYTEFEAQLDRAFPPQCRLHTPEFFTDYGKQMLPITAYSGVSVSEPSSKYAGENKQTNWYRATHE